MNKNFKLEPCPFCGCDPRMRCGFRGNQNKLKQITIQCKKCFCRTPVFNQLPFESWDDVKNKAVSLWNSRTTSCYNLEADANETD